MNLNKKCLIYEISLSQVAFISSFALITMFVLYIKPNMNNAYIAIAFFFTYVLLSSLFIELSNFFGYLSNSKLLEKKEETDSRSLLFLFLPIAPFIGMIVLHILKVKSIINSELAEKLMISISSFYVAIFIAAGFAGMMFFIYKSISDSLNKHDTKIVEKTCGTKIVEKTEKIDYKFLACLLHILPIIATIVFNVLKTESLIDPKLADTCIISICVLHSILCILSIAIFFISRKSEQSFCSKDAKNINHPSYNEAVNNSPPPSYNEAVKYHDVNSSPPSYNEAVKDHDVNSPPPSYDEAVRNYGGVNSSHLYCYKVENHSNITQQQRK